MKVKTGQGNKVIAWMTLTHMAGHQKCSSIFILCAFILMGQLEQDRKFRDINMQCGQ